jgi:hypothetical protein
MGAARKRKINIIMITMPWWIARSTKYLLLSLEGFRSRRSNERGATECVIQK